MERIFQGPVARPMWRKGETQNRRVQIIEKRQAPKKKAESLGTRSFCISMLRLATASHGRSGWTCDIFILWHQSAYGSDTTRPV